MLNPVRTSTVNVEKMSKILNCGSAGRLPDVSAQWVSVVSLPASSSDSNNVGHVSPAGEFTGQSV